MITYADYQRIAESMLGEHEPENRTAVSRTYYAAYHACQSTYMTAPLYQGAWQAIYMEPIVGSGEKITIAIMALGIDKKDTKVIQAIRPELIDCLYGD